jgi:calcineurin-like phosphoesterase family protein
LKDYTSGDTVADYLAKLTDNDRFLAFDQIWVAFVEELIRTFPEGAEKYYNLWDLLFEAKPWRIARFQSSETYKLFRRFMKWLREKWVKTFFVYWNHDDYSDASKHFYEELFDNVDFSFKDENYVFTHYPVWSSNNERHWPGWKFLDIEQQILEDITLLWVGMFEGWAGNIHGHTHSKFAANNIKWYTLINVSVEQGLLNL